MTSALKIVETSSQALDGEILTEGEIAAMDYLFGLRASFTVTLPKPLALRLSLGSCAYAPPLIAAHIGMDSCGDVSVDRTVH